MMYDFALQSQGLAVTRGPTRGAPAASATTCGRVEMHCFAASRESWQRAGERAQALNGLKLSPLLRQFWPNFIFNFCHVGVMQLVINRAKLQTKTEKRR